MLQFIKRNHQFLLLLLFFLFYFMGGFFICVTTESASTMDVFFFSDTVRVYGDLTDTIRVNDLMITELNHYRSLVHPVFMILLNPLVKALHIIFSNYLIAVVFLQSLVGALNVVLVHKILNKLTVKNPQKNLLTIIYGFSFTQFLFSMQPETFIFAAAFLILFWYFILYKLSQKTPIKPLDIALLIILGILCLGITLTNYMQFLLGLVILIYFNELDRKRGALLFLVIILSSFSLTVVLNNMQIGFWRSSGNFLVYLIDFLINPNNDEKTYISLTISASHFINILKSTVMHNFVAPKINFTKEFVFGSYSIVSKLIIVIQFLSFCISYGYYCIARRKNTMILFTFSFALGLNCLLHLLYGNHELILYTQHFTFIMVILMGIVYGEIDGWMGYLVSGMLWMFLLNEVIHNYMAMDFIYQSVKILYPTNPAYLRDLSDGFLFIFMRIIYIFILLLFLFKLPVLVKRKSKALVVLIILMLAPLPLKFIHDTHLQRNIIQQGQPFIQNERYNIYRLENKLLYEFYKEAEGLLEAQTGHGIQVNIANGKTYLRDNIDFNKETGSRLFSPAKDKRYYMIELFTSDIISIEVFKNDGD